MPSVDPSLGTVREATLGRLAEIFCTFQGEGPHVGRRHVFLRLAGCDVGCRYCDTPDALRAGAAFEVHAGAADDEVEALENPVSAARVAELVAAVAERHDPVHAISVTGGEPLEQAEFLDALLPRLDRWPVLLETAGTLPDALARVIDHVSIVAMDLKLPSVARTEDHFAAHRRFLELARIRETYVKVVVSQRLDPAEWDQAVRLVREVAPNVPFIVQPETDRRGSPTLPYPALVELAATASEAGIQDVRVIPQVHKYLGIP